MEIFNDRKTRGVQDVLIAVTDGLKGSPESLGVVFPATTLQTLHRAPDPQQPRLRTLEVAQGPGGGPEDHHTAVSADTAEQA